MRRWVFFLEYPACNTFQRVKVKQNKKLQITKSYKKQHNTIQDERDETKKAQTCPVG
jgi:hypothetical protein